MSPSRIALPTAATAAVFSTVFWGLAAGCAGIKTPQQQGNGGAGGTPGLGDGGGCRNLQCRQVSCAGDASTTLTGTVYAPNGTLPLYNVLVYVPNAPVPPIPTVLTCDRCGAIPPGEPVVAALTDARGVFTLKGVPIGADVPVVIQVGKWRRQLTVPMVTACQENRVDDPEKTRLPRNRGEGDMPRIAVTTGSCDTLVCLLPKLGIDQSELGVAGQGKAVTFYGGAEMETAPMMFAENYGGLLPGMANARDLWRNFEEIKKYDMVMGSCECTDEGPSEANKGPIAYQVMTQYLASGGRLFGTDAQYVWYKYSPDPGLNSLVQFAPFPGQYQGANPIVLDTSFPKGAALADWLDGISPGRPHGEVNCYQIYDNVTSVAKPAGQVWGASVGMEQQSDVRHPRILTANTPVGLPAAQQCGRAVHIDGHVAPYLSWQQPYPAVCGSDLTDGERVLAFFLFDAAACIQEDSKPVMPPPLVP